MDAWKEQVDPKVLTEINRKKKAKGKPRIVRHGTGSPANAWVRFTKDMAIEYPSSTTPEGQKYIHWLASRTKERWDQLSDAEKKPYVDEHKRELAAWRANRDAGKNA
ncbi:hypothetical protein OF83DRAFT_452048 [Amylostereum chailletii]|nr:hypothetical protein OF83DRAFT_452048 [Amylostereum chailletii]